MSPLTLAVLLLLLASIWTFINILYAPKKLPPGPPGLPIIGNLHKLTNLPHRYLGNLAKQYGPIMSLRLGQVPAVVISSPKAAELILKTHDIVFASRPKAQTFDDYETYGNYGLAFTPYGPYWRNVRKMCTLHLLSASKIESFAPIRKMEVESMVHSLKEAAAMHEVVDLSKKVNELIEESTCRMIFGRRKGDGLKLMELIHQLMILAGNFNIAAFLSFLGPFDLQRLRPRMNKIFGALDKILDTIIEEHEQKTPSKQGRHRDFVDMLLSMMNQPMNISDEQETTLDRVKIKAILLDMFIGASDTSIGTIEWTLSELMKHPQVMKLVQEELKSFVGMNRIVEETDLGNLTYLDMVIKESFRLHPIAPLIVPRESMEDIEINGYYIPKKTRILVNAWAIGHDPDTWSKNAEEFYPERFINSNIKLKGRDFQLIPFGSGRRGCPGLQLGLIKVKYAIAQLMHCFDWELPNGMSPNDLDMQEKNGLAVPRANPLLVIPTYRLLS